MKSRAHCTHWCTQMHTYTHMHMCTRRRSLPFPTTLPRRGRLLLAHGKSRDKLACFWGKEESREAWSPAVQGNSAGAHIPPSPPHPAPAASWPHTRPARRPLSRGQAGTAGAGGGGVRQETPGKVCRSRRTNKLEIPSHYRTWPRIVNTHGTFAAAPGGWLRRPTASTCLLHRLAHHGHGGYSMVRGPRVP